MPKVKPYLIAGGASRRMNVDKRTIEIDGESLIERQCRLLKEATGQDPVIVGDVPEEMAPKRIRIIPDVVKDGGPLAGLVSAMMDAGEGWILALGVDLPELQLEDLEEMLKVQEEAIQVMTLTSDGRPEPLAAVYKVSSLSFWRRRLDTGNLALHEGISHLGWRAINPVSSQHALVNLNRPEDLDRFLARRNPEGEEK